MNMTYEYYLLTHSAYDYPYWAKTERYFNCTGFTKLFSIFKARNA